MRFVDRHRELAGLSTFLRTERAGLLVLYGRRRVGKTSLLSHWLEEVSGSARRPPIFWTATTQSADYQLQDLSNTLLASDPRHPGSASTRTAFVSWEAAFLYLAELASVPGASGPLVVIIDEFTYLVQSDPGLVGVLQRVWDHALSKAPNLRLILSGSLVGVMEQSVLSARAPLYGRATTMRLRPLEYGALVELLPGWRADARVAVHAVCGGIPAYLDLFERAGRFDRGLLEYGLTPNSIFLTDAALLLGERLDEPHVYESILATIAGGFHEWSDIARMARVPETRLSAYLSTLQALELVRRVQPVLAPAGNKRGRYEVADAFLRFYYRFIVPHRTAIQRGLMGRTVQTIIEDMRAFIGQYVFEDLCRDWVLIQAESGELGWLPEEYGAYWLRSRKQAVQLDVVAASSRQKRLLIGEAKWAEGPVGRAVLVDLIERSRRMPEVAAGWKVDYAAFARAGFTEAARTFARETELQLVTLDDVERAHVRLIQPPALHPRRRRTP
jgi:hypothetical protein